MNKYKFGLLGLLLLSFGISGYSQTAGASTPNSYLLTPNSEKMSLNDCIKTSMENNIALQSAKKNTEKARILQGTAWDLEQTELSLSQDPTSGGSPDNSLTLSQSIDFPTRYVARRHQLKAQTRVAESNVDVLQNALKGKITSLYYQLVYQKEKIRILQRQDTILHQYEETATKRYKAGEVRQLEPLNARRLLHENELEMNVARTDFVNTQTALGRLIGDGRMIDPATTALSPIAFDNSQAYNYMRTAEGRQAQAQAEAADKAIKVAKSAYAPSLSLALRTQMVIKGWNPYHVDRGWNDGNFMGFEIGVGIPIFNGATRARVKAARKDRELIDVQMKNDAQQRQSEYTAAMNNMLAAQKRLHYYTSTGNNEAMKVGKLSNIEYENGEINYIEYVSAMQQDIDTRLKYAAAINDYNQSVITLKTLRSE